MSWEPERHRMGSTVPSELGQPNCHRPSRLTYRAKAKWPEKEMGEARSLEGLASVHLGLCLAWRACEEGTSLPQDSSLRVDTGG